MNTSLKRSVQLVRDFWEKQPPKKRTIIVSSAIAILAVAVLLTVLLNTKNYVQLYTGLSTSESAESDGSTYKLDDKGNILVPKKNEAKIKMNLAADGYPKSTLTYDIYTKNSSLTSTDSDKKTYNNFQLQDRLQDSIKTIEGVENAIVTINVPDEDSFVLKDDKQPATASVTLTLAGNTELSKKQVNGIVQLVAKSVSGLKAENVVVVDQSGEVLNNSSDNSDGSSNSGTKLEVTNGVNKAFQEKILSLLEPIFGKGGVKVAVNAVIDFQKKTSAETKYSPVVNESGIVSKQQTSKEGSGSGTGASGVVGTGSNTGVNTYQQSSSGNSGTNSASSDSSSTEYLVNQIVENIQNDGGDVKDMTVSVVINKDQLSQAEINKYREVVAYGAGISIEKVNVIATPFAKTTQTSQTGKLTPKLLIIIISSAVVVLGAVLALILLTKAKKKKQKEEEESKALETGVYQVGYGISDNTGEIPQPVPEETGVENMTDDTNDKEDKADTDQNTEETEKAPEVKDEIVLTKTREQELKEQIGDFAENNPEIVAQLLRTWMKEDDDNRSK